MRKGRPPKPTQLKVIEGNRGKRKIPNEPTPAIPADCPRAPEWLQNPLAVAFWEENAPALHSCGLMTLGDAAVFAVIADTYARLREALADIDDRGRVIEFVSSQGKEQQIPNPAIQEADRLRTQFHRMASDFGMTPSGRSGLKVATPRTAEDKLKDRIG